LDFVEKFEMANRAHTAQIGFLEVDRRYPILSAERINTKYGSTVLMNIGDSPIRSLKDSTTTIHFDHKERGSGGYQYS
jgi:hypothetical protein